MSHQDKKSPLIPLSSSASKTNTQALKMAVIWLFKLKDLQKISVRKGTTWKPHMLAIAAIFWAVSDLHSLGEPFDQARNISRNIFRRQPEPGNTYQGFIKTLKKWHDDLMIIIFEILRTKMELERDQEYRVVGFVLFAVDGSRIEVPRTKSNRQAFSPQRKKKNTATKKKKNTTGKRKSAKRKKPQKQTAASIEKKGDMSQIWLTMLWHVGTGLPWAWRCGAADCSERHHFKEMLSELPENSVITADAGFVGYEFWKAVLDANQNFVIRVGSNVKLLKNLGYARERDQTVYLWPDKFAKKNMPPLVLRLIEVHNGKHPVYLVTNMTTKRELSDAQAAEIYRRRWGIEVFFRTFKQTFGCTKLRSKSSANALIELDWSLIGLWTICLYGQCVQSANGKPPSQMSAAGVIRAFRMTMREHRCRPLSVEESLWNLLANAIGDDYNRTRSKASRNYPRKKQRKKISPPIIEQSTQQQIETAQELKQHNTQFQFTA